MKNGPDKRTGEAMRVNIFSGGRRIALAIGAFWLAGVGVWIAVTWHGYIPSLAYEIHEADGALAKVGWCSYGSRVLKYGIVVDDWPRQGASHPVDLELCRSDWLQGQLDGTSDPKARSDFAKRIHTVGSSEMAAYTASPAFIADLRADRDTELIDPIQTALGVAAGGAAVLWLFAAIIGWIVRGFLGVPRGEDFPRARESR